MSEFAYVVLDNTGKELKGNIESESSDLAISKLRADGYTVLSVERANMLNKEMNISIGQSIKPRDLSVFCRSFISMVRAGVTILDTLDMLADSTENKTMAAAIRGAYTEIQKGETLSDALAKYPKVFPSIMVSMVAAGEASGKIDVAFDRMSTHFEKSAKMRGIIKKAAIYPIIVVVVSIVVVIVMLVKVIPSYESMFEQLGGELPGITKAVMAASNLLTGYWFIIVPVLIAIIVAISAYKKTLSGKRFFGKLSRKVPIFGKLFIKQAASNFARTLSTLVFAGLPMIEALGITAKTMSNYIYEEALNNAKEEVAKGIPLSEPIIGCGLFPPMVGHMTKIGEETGDLEGMLTKLADYYDEEVEITTQSVIAALEPMIILILAAIVCVLIAAIMAPMISMYAQMDSL